MQMDNGEWETSKFVESKAYEVQWKQAAWNGWMFQINFSGFFIHSSNELRELGLKALLVIINSEKTQNKEEIYMLAEALFVLNRSSRNGLLRSFFWCAPKSQKDNPKYYLPKSHLA